MPRCHLGVLPCWIYLLCLLQPVLHPCQQIGVLLILAIMQSTVIGNYRKMFFCRKVQQCFTWPLWSENGQRTNSVPLSSCLFCLSLVFTFCNGSIYALFTWNQTDGIQQTGCHFSDECNEEGEHHVDEEGDEGVKVELAEDPHQCAALLHFSKRYKHVISVDQREKALWHHGQRAKLCA